MECQEDLVGSRLDSDDGRLFTSLIHPSHSNMWICSDVFGRYDVAIDHHVSF